MVLSKTPESRHRNALFYLCYKTEYFMQFLQELYSNAVKMKISSITESKISPCYLNRYTFKFIILILSDEFETFYDNLFFLISALYNL